ncbi:MAG TPA: FAD-binding oxidoreductase [Chloroflexota bacterium]
MAHALTSTANQALAGELRSRFQGPIVPFVDPDYEDVRRIWNAAIRKRPALFARCIGAEDVVAAVLFAREHDLEIAVRAGGHNVGGTALTDGGLVIDLQLMKGMRVDAGRQTLLAQPGLRLGDVDHKTQAFGLALVSGINSETGLAGLTLGGGIGWQMRLHGLTIDHLLSADVVTAGGEMVKASAEEHPDLFWAIRGGGGNFGIVTAFEFGLVELGPAVYGGTVLYPAEQAAEVLRAYRDWAACAPEEVTTILVQRRNAFPWAPPESQGQPIIGVGALYSGQADRGAEALAPLQRLGPVLASSFQARPFTQHQEMWDASSPAGRLYYWKSHFMPGLSDAAIDAIANHAWRFSSPVSFSLLSHMGGAIRRRSDDQSAFTGRDAEFTININCAATEPGLYERDRAWLRDWFEVLEPHSTGGVYVNFVGDEGSERVRAAYGQAKYDRLAAVKAVYDPENVFRLNQNIKPKF